MKASEKMLNCINDLPCMAGILPRIMAADPQSAATDLVDIIKTDPSFTARVLRLANSAYIGMPNTVSSLQNAVVILGRKRIQSLAMISCGIGLCGGGLKVISFRRFWRHSLAVGILCESIGKHCLRYESFDVDELFAAGVLHDIGMLILAKAAPGHLHQIIDKMQQSQKKPFFCLEPQDNNHGEMGIFAARQWHFPEVLVQAIGFHHAPLRAENYSRQVAIVHIADAMAKMIGLHTIEADTVALPDDRALNLIPLPLERLRVIAHEALDDQKRIESLLDALL
ncbi:MAG: HDOD domain-containing protein [Chitinivibrionales bacterium]